MAIHPPVVGLTRLADLPDNVRRDREFGPAVWLLTSPLLADRTDQYIWLEHRLVDWEKLLARARGWSSGEKMLLAVAFNLWSNVADLDEWLGEGRWLNPYAWRATLSAEHFRRVLQALALSGGQDL